MICDECQTRNNYYHKFCQKCGAKLNIPDELKDELDVDLPPVQEVEEVYNPQMDLLAQSKKKKKKRRYLVLTIGIITLLVAAAIFIFYSLFIGPSDLLKGMIPKPISIVSTVGKQTSTPSPSSSPITTEKLSTIPVTFSISKPSSLSVQTQTGIYMIKGTINAKAKIVTDTEVVAPFSVDAATGFFTITVKLPEGYEIYPVTLTAKNEGELDTVIVLQMERIVNEVEYRKSAVDLKYSDLIANPTQYIGKVASFSGRIQKIIQMEKSVQFTLETENNANQPLFVNYIGDTTIMEGNRIQLVGEITDMKDGKPSILARLGYKVNP